LDLDGLVSNGAGNAPVPPSTAVHLKLVEYSSEKSSFDAQRFRHPLPRFAAKSAKSGERAAVLSNTAPAFDAGQAGAERPRLDPDAGFVHPARSEQRESDVMTPARPATGSLVTGSLVTESLVTESLVTESLVTESLG
jgi:hypothetical protein